MTSPIIYDLSKLQPALRKIVEDDFADLFSRKPDRLLGIDTNAKTIKGNKRGFLTAILYLAPANMSGENLCAMAFIAQCDLACLFTAGRGKMTVNVMSRLRKALYWQQYRDEFLAQLTKEIQVAYRRAEKRNLTLLVRLNGTSDIRWENYGIPQSLPHVQFYDYTKLHNRRGVPANYDLTFSYSGVAAYQPFVQKAVAAGKRIAVVFRSRDIVERMLANGETFLGLPLVDGDDTDIRHMDPLGCAVALYAKGSAITDQTGFVVDDFESSPMAMAA